MSSINLSAYKIDLQLNIPLPALCVSLDQEMNALEHSESSGAKKRYIACKLCNWETRETDP